MKPITNTSRKIAIAIRPVSPIFLSDIAHGKRNAISKSKIINNIATK
jgi:hypothetical protein